MANPWGKVSTPAATQSLQDVMSEELVEQLQKEEMKNITREQQIPEPLSDPDTRPK